MKSSLALLVVLLFAAPAFAQGRHSDAANGAHRGRVAASGNHYHGGNRQHNAWRGGAAGRHSYVYRSPHHHHRNGGYYGHAGFRRGWGYYGYYSRPSYIYLDRDVYGYGYPAYG